MSIEHEVMAWARNTLRSLLRVSTSLDDFDRGTIKAVMEGLDPERNPLLKVPDITERPDNSTPAFMRRLGVEPEPRMEWVCSVCCRFFPMEAKRYKTSKHWLAACEGCADKPLVEPDPFPEKATLVEPFEADPE